MGLTLMADDRDLIIGEIRGAVAGLKGHLESQDRNIDRRFTELVEKHERDKQEAIQARAEREARDAEKFKRIEEKATLTYGLASMNERWISEEGKPALQRLGALDGRVSLLEQARDAAEKKQMAARNRALGATAVWGTIAAGIGGLATIAGLMGLDGIAALLERLARTLGAS